MGAAYSEPVEIDFDLPLVCITFRSPNKIRVINGLPEVINMIDSFAPVHRIECGVTEFKTYGSSPFAPKNSKEESTYGKKVAIIILEEMYKMGYDLVVSADISRTVDRSSWFFEKKEEQRENRQIFCVSPSENDKITLFHAADEISCVLKELLESFYRESVLHEQFIFFYDEVLHEFTLMSNIWISTGEESIALKELLISIITQMGQKHWKLHCTSTLKQYGSSFFFIKDTTYTVESTDLMMISLNRHNRLRFINCPLFIYDEITNFLNSFYQINDSADYCGSYEIKLYGSPWDCKGYEALMAKYTITSLMSFLHSKGWSLLSTFYCSRKVTRKSVFLMSITSSENFLYGCISLSGRNKLHLINIPPHLSEKLKQVILESYIPGISTACNISDADFKCLEFKLDFDPWCTEDNYETAGLHARKTLMNVINLVSSHGWSIFSPIDISSQCCNTDDDSYPENVQSLLLRKQDSAPSYFECINFSFTEVPPPKYEDLFDVSY